MVHGVPGMAGVVAASIVCWPVSELPWNVTFAVLVAVSVVAASSCSVSVAVSVAAHREVSRVPV